MPADRGVPRRDGERIPETGNRGMMTNTQKELLQALRCFMQGDEEYHLPERFSQLKELCDLAAMHKILAIIYEMIRRDAVLLLEENAPLAAKWKKSAIAEVMLQVQRTAGFLELYQKLQKEGVYPLVVKLTLADNDMLGLFLVSWVWVHAILKFFIFE